SLIIEMIVGFFLVTGVFVQLASVVGLALYISIFWLFPFADVISYVHYAGILFYLFVVTDTTLPQISKQYFFKNLRAYLHQPKVQRAAKIALRVCMGVGLIVVAFLNKLYQPAYALAFLQMQHINFHNDLFVLAAGLTEAALGVLIIVGVL